MRPVSASFEPNSSSSYLANRLFVDWRCDRRVEPLFDFGVVFTVVVGVVVELATSGFVDARPADPDLKD